MTFLNPLFTALVLKKPINDDVKNYPIFGRKKRELSIGGGG
jgi:hypothetical protein